VGSKTIISQSISQSFWPLHHVPDKTDAHTIHSTNHTITTVG